MTDAVTLPKTDAHAIDPRCRPYQPFGSALDAMYAKESEVIMVGPAGTGKSRAILEKLHLCASKYPNMRGLMIRKTRESLTQSAMVTYEKFVVPENNSVHFRTQEQEYRYGNGSVIVVGGMDKSSKVLSSDYDMIYPQEATELSEEDWEILLTRCRNGIMPYNQLIGDCNPGSPYHWMKKRIDGKKVRHLLSVHEDNPILYDRTAHTWTPRGIDYISKLDSLSGVRYLRLRKGIWASAEGMIYTEWDQQKHLLNHFDPPPEWTRIWVVDFGYTHPFVWQAWAFDEDDRAYLFAEIYHTHLLVQDAATMIRNWKLDNNEPNPEAIICDWDAEDRATLERYLDLDTMAAEKDVATGIQDVKTMLKIQADGKPRLHIMRDSLLERDFDLDEAGRPTCTQEEIEGYEWEDSKVRDKPKKIDDHGMDCTRYLAKYVEESRSGWVRPMAR